ncbi:MAG: error-prone DNA polymerase [Idiomarina sp.]
MAYAELHCLTNYSFLRGASHPHELVQRAIELGYQALAITDECSVAGVVRAYTAVKNTALKLIIGSEFHHPELGVLIVLAPTRQAYGQLCQLITRARNRAKKGSYQVQASDFLQGCEACLILWQPPVENFPASFGQALKQVFPDSCWLLYERHYQSSDGECYQRLQGYQQELDLPLVAAGNVHLHDAERQPLHDVLTAIRLLQPVAKVTEQLLPNREYHLRSLRALEHCYPQALLDETLVIAARCQFCLSELRYEYPAELVPEGMSAIDYLRQLTLLGAKKRFPNGITAGVQQKLDKELGLIESLHYEYFFLTIHDLVQFAQQRGILYQGRGSAANSVVCYCLEITAVNPDQIDVLFERFISAERDEPPDIDVDFEHQRREEVIQYIYQKYGRDRAALTATVIRYRLRSALKDVGKALGFTEQALAHYLAKIDKRDQQESWQQQLLAQVPDLAAHAQGQWLLQLVDLIKGFPRHLSQHVGGFVIAAGSLTELVPIENAAMPERTVIQWDKDDLEELRLIKVDVLALGMLTALNKMFQLMQKVHQQPMTMADIPTEDSGVYRMLQRADSVGVFQVESRAQMSMLPRLRPATFYDLVIQIAIVRPGPIQGDMVHPYLQRRRGLEAVEYPSEEVATVLQRTLGVPIFQEQVIKLAMVAAGFSGGEADQLRRAMATWRSTGELQQFERRLTDGMLERGYSAEFAARIYRQICGFGEYGFPESHSASFANLAYASAWVKYYYPAAFYTALLNSLPMGFYSASQLVQDARRHQVVVLPVDIQHSTWDHQLLSKNQQAFIRLGFRLIKGVSKLALQNCLKQRPATGFSSIEQLKSTGISGIDLDKLAASDTLSALAGHRYQTRWQALALQEAQLPLFGNAGGVASQEVLPAPDELSDIAEDYQALGVSLRRHPLALLREQGHLKGCKTAAELPGCRHKQLVHLAGIVTCRQRPGTSGGVTFLTLEDETGNANVVIWLVIARKFRAAYLTARVLQVTGVLETDGEVTHVIAAKLSDITNSLDRIAPKSRDFH